MPHAAPLSGPALCAAVLDGLRAARFTCTYSIAWHLLWPGKYLPHIPGGRYLPPGSVAKAADAVRALIADGKASLLEVGASFDRACERKGCPSDTAADLRSLVAGTRVAEVIYTR